ncbi:MAG: hypothetical protein AAB217_23405, partial [Chloroflexota bacterium]
MKCPNCNHISTSALFKCSSCGEAYDRSALETIEHLDYVLAWLDEQAIDLRPDIYTVLRSTAAKQLEATRAKLPAAPALLTSAKPEVASQPPPAPPVAPQPPVVARSPEQIARALALVEAALDEIRRWHGARAISPASADRLREHLAARAFSLRAELGGRTVTVELPSKLQAIEFALGSLAQWVEGRHLIAGETESLKRHLQNE